MQVKGDYFLPYNPKLVDKAKEMRRNPTPAEFKMWYFLRFLNPRFLRQRPIDNFIVDFYCSELKLVIEIDGEPHFTEEGRARDAERTEILNSHGLKVMRFSNSEVLNNFEIIKRQISELIKTK
ncbi:MAG: endonuclease domain-containing protein [Patescibacteria group bacterium]|jgi:very-short-patch-repair endonuclease